MPFEVQQAGAFMCVTSAYRQNSQLKLPRLIWLQPGIGTGSRLWRTGSVWDMLAMSADFTLNSWKPFCHCRTAGCQKLSKAYDSEVKNCTFLMLPTAFSRATARMVSCAAWWSVQISRQVSKKYDYSYKSYKEVRNTVANGSSLRIYGGTCSHNGVLSTRVMQAL